MVDADTLRTGLRDVTAIRNGVAKWAEAHAEAAAAAKAACQRQQDEAQAELGRRQSALTDARTHLRAAAEGLNRCLSTPRAQCGGWVQQVGQAQEVVRRAQEHAERAEQAVTQARQAAATVEANTRRLKPAIDLAQATVARAQSVISRIQDHLAQGDGSGSSMPLGSWIILMADIVVSLTGAADTTAFTHQLAADRPSTEAILQKLDEFGNRESQDHYLRYKIVGDEKRSGSVTREG